MSFFRIHIRILHTNFWSITLSFDFRVSRSTFQISPTQGFLYNSMMAVTLTLGHAIILHGDRPRLFIETSREASRGGRRMGLHTAQRIGALRAFSWTERVY